MAPINITLSILGGFIPSILWLLFWLQEDKINPEPKRKIILSFFYGMLAVIFVLPIEKAIYSLFGNVVTVFTIVSWAFTEEILKFAAAYFSSLRKNIYNDEPIDAFIYLISSALGFGALENSLFLLKAMDAGIITQNIISGNMRFIGATLLHVLSSATIGIFIAFGFYMNKDAKKTHLFTGILFAIILHALFNWFIINSGGNLFFVFAGVWISIITIIFLIEKVKTIKQ